MQSSRLSLRSTIVFILVVMSVALVVMSWEVYRKLALDNQRRALAELVAYETDEIFANLEEHSRNIGMAAQHERLFRKAYRGGDRAGLVSQLKSQFNQYYVTADILDLVQLTVFDVRYQVVAQVTTSRDTSDVPQFFCPGLVTEARQRTGPAKLKALDRLCKRKNRPYVAVIVPVGGLRPIGYLQIVVSPIHNLKRIQQALGGELRLRYPDKAEAYRSERWDKAVQSGHSLTAEHLITTSDGTTALHLELTRDISDFEQELMKTRDLVAFVAGVVTFVTVILALIVLHNTTLKPLQILTKQLSRVRQDRSRLGEPIEVSGNAEVSQLATVFNDMSAELSRLYNKYKQMAFTDPLTALPNRALFQRRLAERLDKSRGNSPPFAVVLLDLNGFKEVNDALGHQVGDTLLRQVSRRLRHAVEALTQDDWNNFCDDYNKEHGALDGVLVCRIGGDEFAILLPSTADRNAVTAVVKYIAHVLEPLFELEEQPISIGGSFGVAMYPDHGKDMETLVRRADVALYAAKSTKQNYAFYNESLDQHSLTHLKLKTELGDAIRNEELVVYYQPKLNLHDNGVQSVEALVRWAHPVRGLIMPDQFIALAEERGLIHSLTEWVIAESLRQHLLWKEQGVALNVAVNLSSSVLYDLELPDKIDKLLRKYRVQAGVLELEITEDATMIDPDRALTILTRLSDMGIRLTIDDFGTGYSSLGYLKRLPVQQLKIDKSFVQEMSASDSDTKIVHATIDLAHNLGLNVVAEGVETDSLITTLSRLECDYAQGYGISVPLRAGDILSWAISWGASKGQREVSTVFS